MRLIGLTGGIGTGKSTVSNYLASKGCIIIDADKILVIKDGEIKESGTHKELLIQEGIYYNLYKKQFIKEQMDNSIK